jgi:hypothetical protein
MVGAANELRRRRERQTADHSRSRQPIRLSRNIDRAGGERSRMVILVRGSTLQHQRELRVHVDSGTVIGTVIESPG